jgi:predicted nuclease of predicted toxin-antitoxin system
VKILFDQGTPAPLRHHLPGHTIVTAYENGWQTLRNGELLAQAQAEAFQVVVTTDQNCRHQQTIRGRKIAVVILGSTSWPKLQTHISSIALAIDSAIAGEFSFVDVT